jgi:hypothetical protein
MVMLAAAMPAALVGPGGAGAATPPTITAYVPTQPAIAAVLAASPTGHGTACSNAVPCSLLEAQTRARQLEAAAPENINVSLAGGTYDLTHTLSFGPQDSGRNGYEVSYRGATSTPPILSGAVSVTGWHLVNAAKNIWAAPVTPCFDTEQLYVDGQRVPMAQGLPSAYYLQIGGGFISSSPVLASVKGDIITMAEPCWNNLHLPGDGSQEVSWVYGPQGGFGGLSGAAQPSFFENAYPLLSPGHWSIDTTSHQLFYVPAAGQQMNQLTVSVPVLQTLVSVQGTLADPVHNLSLDGLQFSYGTWTQPSTDQGFAEMQADWTLTGANASNAQGTCGYSIPAGTCPYASWTRTPANVVLSATHDVTMEGDTFSHLGGAGLDVEYGSQDDVITGNTFDDIAASGIQLGSTNDPEPSDVGGGSDEINLGNVITDNYIHDVAIQYLGGIGIWVGYSQGSEIEHNQIDDVPYTGISIGWAGWHANILTPNSDPNVNADNTISDNLIYNYMQVLGDGGAIYTNGGQATGWNTQLVLNGNVAYGGTNTDFALYTDTGSKYETLTDNVVYDQPLDSFSTGGCHTVGHLRIDHNYFAQLGPLYPCDLVTDVVAQDNTLVCDAMTAAQAPATLLAGAGLEPAYRLLLTGAPVINLVGPGSLPLSGGRILISGSGFTPSSSVTVGGRAATTVTVLSANYLLVVLPAGTGTGAKALQVTTAAGTSAPTSTDVVTYSAYPTPCVPLIGGNISSSLVP